MSSEIRARLERELSRRRWTAENHEKLIDFLAAYAGSGAVALFDADNTAWTGDVGDSALLHLARRLRLSPRISEVLPRALDVPAEGFGVPRAGRLFPAARVGEAMRAMAAAWRRRVSPSGSDEAFLAAFSEDLVRPGGALHGDLAFRNAHRLYAGTLAATYTLLEASVGCLAFHPTRARTQTALFPEPARAYFGGAVPFPEILDTGPDQAALRAEGRLGCYSQIAVWTALDKTPDEVRAVGLEVFGSVEPETRRELVFPVDEAGAAAPAPLDLGVDPARVVPGASIAGGVVAGSTTMIEGTRHRPEMEELMATMARHGIVPVVITASHVELVRAVLDRHYGFAGHLVLGMNPVLVAGRYGADLAAPATYRHGKVEAARAAAGRPDARPAFAAGDTTTDLEMLAYADGYRLFFDRGKRPLMDFAAFLVARGLDDRTLVQAPF